MATKMLTSTPTKEKKKSSPNKHNRSSGAGTLKRNPNYELKKDELVQLLGRFEAELQAKEIAIATLKSEKLKSIISSSQFGRLNGQNDPHFALLRDSEYVKDESIFDQNPMKNLYESQIVQLEELIGQQRKQVQNLNLSLEQAEQRYRLLSVELEKEKRDKIRFQTFHNQLRIVQEEKISLKNELNDVHLQNKELEQQLMQVMQLLEYQQERHKKFVALILHERQVENQIHQETLKKFSNQQTNNVDVQLEGKLKELELENERNKKVLTERIQQLQSEIEILVKEKQQPINKNHEENIESNGKFQTKTSSTSATINETNPIGSSTVISSSSTNVEKSVGPTSSTNGAIRRPTVIPAPSNSKNSVNSGIKPTQIIPVAPSRIQSSNSNSSSPEIPLSPVPIATKRNFIPTRSISNQSQSPISSTIRSSPINSQSSNGTLSTTINQAPRTSTALGGIPRLAKTSQQITKPNSTGTAPAPNKRAGQTSFSSEHKIDNLQALLETIQSVAENRLKSSIEPANFPENNDNTDIKNISSSSSSSSSSSPHSELILFRAAENGDIEKMIKFLKLGSNPNSQTTDGNTCLHLATLNNHIEGVRTLLTYGSNPFLENNFGLTPWNFLSNLQESDQLELLKVFIEVIQCQPPIHLIFDAIDRDYPVIYGYLLSVLHEELKMNSVCLSQLFKTALRSSNTYFLECLFSIVSIPEFIELFDPNTFISNECLSVLSTLGTTDTQNQPIGLIVRIASSGREHPFSYAIGNISITNESSWIDIERICTRLFIDHITQIDSPFDYLKSSIGCAPNQINTLRLGFIKWQYQDTPLNESPTPYAAAQEQTELVIHLKNIDNGTTDCLAYNYLIPSQNLKTFVRYVEQNQYVGVYGAPHLQKKTLFEDLIKHLERPTTFSTTAKFKVIRFEFENLQSFDDFVDALVEQEFFRLSPSWTSEQQSTFKYLLFLPNIQNSTGTEALNFLLNSDSISNGCHQIQYTREDTPDSTTNFYFPSVFHIFITMSKRTWSTENDVYKKFKWIPFKIDSVPWNGLLKRHLWRRMIDTNIRENRQVDPELIKTLQWVTNVWQRYNECLQKLSIQDALLGPGLFFDCPMNCSSIYEWLQNKWNTAVAPLVREHSMSKCAQPKSKGLAAAANAIASSFRANSLEVSTPYESVACTALYVLLHRAVSRDCPLTGQEREQYLLNFVGSRLEGGGTASMLSSASSSRASTPQPTGHCDFVSIQLE